ncbi:MAG: hypothetical protein KJ734_03255 [Chloroflexi bacterium]|nr:hypothetical protein [Chloroflexota bacterium]
MPVKITRRKDRVIFQFDEPEACGTIIVQPGDNGLEITIPEVVTDTPVALVDLYYLSPEAQRECADAPDDRLGVPGLVFWPTDQYPDPVGYVRFYPPPRGTRVEFEMDVQEFEAERGPQYGLPPEEEA